MSGPAATHPRRRSSLRARAVGASLVAAIAATGASSIALAKPPGGVAENPGAAVATVVPSDVPVGGTVAFTGTGFNPEEQVSVKIDDGDVFKGSGKGDVFLIATAAADGTISGSIPLASVNPQTPVGAGAHLLRFLSGAPRSLHADFTVGGGTPTVAPTPTTGGASTPAPTSTAGGGNTTTPGSSTTTPVSTTPVAVDKDDQAVVAPVSLKSTKLKASKSAVALSLKAGVAGSSGTIKIVTASKVKVSGRGKAKVVTLTKSDSYFLGKLGKAGVKLRLSADGKKVLKKGRSLAAVVQFRDVTGVKVVQNVTVKG